MTEFGRSQLYRWSDPADWSKIRIVHCGVEPLFLDLEPDPPPEEPRFVCVGRLAEQKGQLVLIEAAGKLAAEGLEFGIMLVGDGPMRRAIEDATRRLGLEDRVQIAGWMDTRGVHDAILQARALVLPSFAEGLPVVIMEALALGRPVISTYIAGIPELVESGRSGWLVPAGAVEPLAAAMVAALAADPAELRAMGRAGADRVAERHDVATEAKKLADLIADPDAIISHGPLQAQPATAMATP